MPTFHVQNIVNARSLPAAMKDIIPMCIQPMKISKSTKAVDLHRVSFLCFYYYHLLIKDKLLVKIENGEKVGVI